MARWDDLHRAIEARNADGAEQVWLELLETDLDHVRRFLDAARALAQKSGGKRQGGMLLSMLAQALKEKERFRPLVDVYVELAAMGPDDGTVRQGLIDAARAAYPSRADLDQLLEKSGVQGGPTDRLAEQAETLASYLRLEVGAYVYHKSGWGTGRIVDYIPERSRCVIDFKDRPGHEMDIDGAAERLERLDESDLRAMALADPRGLRKWASEEPLEMLRQVLVRFQGNTRLRHLKDALVPDAVATSRWSSWWKEARRLAQLDPRFHVGGGRDPLLEFHGTGQVDFRTQVERVFRGCATVDARQAAARQFLATVAGDEEAKAVLGDVVREQMVKATLPTTQLGWDLVLADLEGRDRLAMQQAAARDTADPDNLLTQISDDAERASFAAAMVSGREDGPEIVYRNALERDDPVLGNVVVERFPGAGHPEQVARLLDTIDDKPALKPNLWAWYVRGLRRNRWDGRTYEPYPLILRLLKVLDAVEYRSRRGGSALDKKGVAALVDVLTSRNGQLVKDAVDHTDRTGARHLVQVLDQNRGIKGRQLQKVQTLILRARPDALKDEAKAVVEGEIALGERMDRVYMTEKGMRVLKAQIDKIVNDEMAENRAEIARAREFGDLSENAEYHAAREKQGLLQAKVDQLNSDLSRAIPITKDIVRTEAVSVGARVKLKDPEGHEYTYTLLGPPDADVKNGIINYLTPLGQALMGRKPGDHVQVTVEDASRDVEVLAIENGLL